MTERESGLGARAEEPSSEPLAAPHRLPQDTTPAQFADQVAASALLRIARAAGAALVRTIDLHDPRTGWHHRQVAHLAGLIARGLGLSGIATEGICLAANLHDIGKVELPRSMLDQTARLSVAELQRLQTHARIGYELLCEIDFPWPVAEMVLQHHERLDGSGYPAGLTGKSILAGARVIAVADVLAAMTADRAYRATPGLAAALDELRQGRGVLYDAAAVDVCVALCERDPAAVFPDAGPAAHPDGAVRGTPPVTAPQVRLTAQQQIVMHLLAEGRSTKDIARSLGLGLGTVKVHLSRAYRALGVRNRVGAVRAVMDESGR